PDVLRRTVRVTVKTALIRGSEHRVELRSLSRLTVHGASRHPPTRGVAMNACTGVLVQLDCEWERIADSLTGRRAVRGWGADASLLDEVRTLRQVVERVNERGHADRSDAILLVLLRHAPTDDLA